MDMRSPYAYAALHIEGSMNIVDELFEDLVRGGSRSARPGRCCSRVPSVNSP